MSAKTVVWGVCADSAGIVVQHTDRTEKLDGGGLRVKRRTRLSHEPATAYARSHAWPMPMRWAHGEEIGEIVALRRAHSNMYTVGTTDLEPDELAALAGEDGLRWSTGTNNRIRSAPDRRDQLDAPSCHHWAATRLLAPGRRQPGQPARLGGRRARASLEPRASLTRCTVHSRVRVRDRTPHRRARLRPPDRRASRDRDQTRRPDHRGQRPPGPMRFRAPGLPARPPRVRTGSGVG